MSELATLSGVSIGQIYRFFTGKNDLIRAIIREDACARIADWANISAELDADRITIEEALARMCMHALSDDDESLSFDVLAEGHRDNEVADTIAEVCRAGRSIISRLTIAANPTVARDKLDGAEEMVLALMFGLGHRTLSRPSLPNDQTAKITAAIVYAALRSF